MPSQLLTNSFLELLEKSELLPPEQFEAAVRKFRLQEMPSGYEAAKTLVLQGVLSRFQADRLMQGRYRGFFVGNYKVLEILGVGGMGWVYTAEDLETGRVVALKILSEHHQHIADMQARMKLEVRAGSRLDHPHIVHAYKAEHTGDVDFLVTEYVEGISLQELAELRGPIDYQQACDFVCQTAAGLQHSHDRGLVHRDIKPANLLVDKSGCLKILDFGLALIRDDEDEFSLAMIFGHDCLGTDDFIPPEQARESFSVDPRADIYSLGCTLYYLLSGKVPFPLQTTPDKIRAHLTKTPRPIQELVPSLPRQVAAAIEKMMAKNPDDRFQSASEVQAALEPFAKRNLVPFDFAEVLVSRCKDAQRRVTAYKARRQLDAEASSASSAARRRMLDSSSKQLQAAVDTGVPGETRPRRSSISLADPLESMGDDEKPALETSTISTSQRSPAASRPAQLVSLDGGPTIHLTRTQMIVGRNRDCDIPISGTGISGHHCEFRFDGEAWVVTDLGSKNGIQINGHETTSQALKPHDQFTIGQLHRFRFEYVRVPRPKRQISWFAIAASLIAGGAAAAIWYWLVA